MNHGCPWACMHEGYSPGVVVTCTLAPNRIMFQFAKYVDAIKCFINSSYLILVMFLLFSKL